jgi:hypothetical protein
LPQPLQVSELPGLFFNLAEEVADSLGLLIVLQEVGQQAVTKKGLGDRENLGGEGVPLFLTQTQALLSFLKKTSMAQRPKYLCTTWTAARRRAVVKKAAQGGSVLILVTGRASRSGSL